MKHDLLMATLLSTAFALPAVAGGPTVAVDDPTPAAEPVVQDWSGPYAGLMYANTNDSDDLLGSGVFVSEQNFEGSGAGLLLGYNLQKGALVYGAELAFLPFTVSGTNNTGEREDYIDLKGRMGYSTGRALFYGVLGYSFATTLESGDPANDLSANGMNFGIGVDYLVSDRFFVGAELLERRLEGDYGDVGFPGFTHETDSSTLTLRLGLVF